MDDARTDERWWHTAAIQATIAEVNRDSKARSEPYGPRDFHPLHRDEGGPKAGGIPIKAGNLTLLRDLWVKKK